MEQFTQSFLRTAFFTHFAIRTILTIEQAKGLPNTSIHNSKEAPEFDCLQVLSFLMHFLGKCSVEQNANIRSLARKLGFEGSILKKGHRIVKEKM